MDNFIVYPAIDLRQGQVVRLKYGDPNQQTVFGSDPAATAEQWHAEGATWIHVVNLDGAFGDKSAENWAVLPAIAAVDSKVQFGGGIRSLQDVERALAAGVNRVILGTVAVEQPELVSEAIEAFGPEAIAVGIDARDGEVKTRGWLEGGGIAPIDLAHQMADRGVKTIIHTDISRDGVLTGVNAERSAEIAAATHLEIIGSGGVATLQDIQKCADLGLAGVITGRAIYEGRISLINALQIGRN